jgi:hypothetical protein
MITGKIDVTKIDKSRLYQGKKGKYLKVLLVETPNSKYENDYMIVQEPTEEERKNKVKTPILGNARIIESKGNRGNGGQSQQQEDNNEDW